MTTYLSAEQILDAVDLPTEDVPVPEWNGVVRVQGMSGAELDKFQARFIDDKGSASQSRGLEMFRARIVAACVVDADGKRLFRSEAEIKRLGDKSANALTRVVDAARRLSGMTEDDQNELTGN
ncbi:hypothetical protein [Streptomyces meridianus]|uniref:Tail assembly chaperone n=1 Tax=Streptomyces meridianus TaxID=2938945 RepID=A0ABT0XES2_9ACTN|nr:hypothetical protein [Streptomyces meridianus]MCM2580443.1 hypothetical protein [Streptomyces meridianus]